MKTVPNAPLSLYDEWSSVLYSAVLRLVRNPMDPEDIVHEAFLEAINKRHQLQNASSEGFWLRKIAINKALNFLRAQKLSFTIDEYPDIADYIEEEEWPGLDPQQVMHEINQLPQGYLVVLTLYVFEDLSHAEIAEALNISASASRSQYCRALQLLRKKLLTQSSHG